MNKILLVLIIISGFLLIFYANNFSPLMAKDGKQPMYSVRTRDALEIREECATDWPTLSLPQDERLLLMDGPVAMAAVDEEDVGDFNFGGTRATYNLFVIYTKETDVLQKKFELLLKSLFKYTKISLHLHIITDESTANAGDIVRKQMHRYNRHAVISTIDVQDCVDKIKDIVQVMMPYFSSHPGNWLPPPIHSLANTRLPFRFLLRRRAVLPVSGPASNSRPEDEERRPHRLRRRVPFRCQAAVRPVPAL